MGDRADAADRHQTNARVLRRFELSMRYAVAKARRGEGYAICRMRCCALPSRWRLRRAVLANT